jgi:hypothetical protein
MKTTNNNPNLRRSKRVSLGSVEENSGNRQSRRKRKQDEFEEEAATVPTETTSGITVAVVAAAAAAAGDNATALPPLTDKEKINLIVTNRLWSDNVETVVYAMLSLTELVAETTDSVNHDENRKIAFRRGAPLAVVKAMKRHEASRDMQDVGCLVLAGVSTVDDTQVDIIETGGLEVCLSAMDRHANDAGVQRSGCSLIGNLWWNSGVRQTVVDGGGLTKVLLALNTYKHHAHVQQCGCYALASLGHESFAGGQMVVDAGGIDITAMENHPHEAVSSCGQLRKNTMISATESLMPRALVPWEKRDESTRTMQTWSSKPKRPPWPS